jgi:hypothetical protein
MASRTKHEQIDAFKQENEQQFNHQYVIAHAYENFVRKMNKSDCDLLSTVKLFTYICLVHLSKLSSRKYRSELSKLFNMGWSCRLSATAADNVRHSRTDSKMLHPSCMILSFFLMCQKSLPLVSQSPDRLVTTKWRSWSTPWLLLVYLFIRVTAERSLNNDHALVSQRGQTNFAYIRVIDFPFDHGVYFTSLLDS